MAKKLYRSKEDRIISGVLGGLGKYFDIDSSLVRLAFIFLVIITGIFPFIVGYILAAIVVPEEPEGEAGQEKKAKKKE